MKELSIEQKAKAYDEALERTKQIIMDYDYDENDNVFMEIFPELKENKESEDEGIRHFLVDFIKVCRWSEKEDQGWPSREECIAWIEKQGNPADKVKPKFKVKYAGSEYDVLEIKEIAGVTYYGIEDEPNHIDYVLPDNCEIVRDHSYGVKEKGNPYSTKSAIFSEQKSAEWSEEDESWFKELELMALSFSNDVSYLKKFFDWLKSLKQRIGWKPSDEQITVLELASKYERVFTPKQIDILIGLKEQLKKLKE